MAERDFPDGRMQKLMGKPWSCWNLPDQPTELDLRKLRDAYSIPDQYKANHQSIPLPAKFMPLFGTHPESDFLSINKCPACGWLLKIQHANKHYLRDSNGNIVCKDSDLAISKKDNKVVGKACHPVGEIKDLYCKKLTLKVAPPPSYGSSKLSHVLRASSSIHDYGSSKSRSGPSSHLISKTDYSLTHSSSSSSQYSRSRSHSQVHSSSSSSSSYLLKSRSGGGNSTSTGSHNSHSINSSSSSINKGKSGKSSSHSSSTSWNSSARSSNTSSTKSSSSHKPPHTNSGSGSYTLSIPCEDMGQNESVEDLLMSNISHGYSGSKHTVHIIATSNSSSKSKSSSSTTADPDYSDHMKFYSDVPEKRLKLDSSHSRNTERDHHHRSLLSHSSSSDSHSGHHDSHGKSKSKHSSSSLMNGTASSHGLSTESSKKNKSSSSSSSHSKNESGSSSKHHLRSSAPATVVTVSKPVVAVSSLSTNSSSSAQSRNNVSLVNSTASSNTAEKEKEKVKTSSPKKKKRKREKDEPRKIIPLKDRNFNPDKHCGVCIDGTDLPCKRSLTCKTHSISLRRAVAGRSQSFDALLSAHKLAKSEEKNNSKGEEIVKEIVPPKPKKKKLSGTSSNSGPAPNDITTLTVVSEPPPYARTPVSPEIEVITVKTKSRPVTVTSAVRSVDAVHCYSRKPRQCPLVSYKQDIQEKFQTIWDDPQILDRSRHVTDEERTKYTFLLRHYQNPFFMTSEPSRAVAKNVREKRNVFSNWNPCEQSVEGCYRNMQWNPVETRRQNNDSDDDVKCIGQVINIKK